MMVVISLSRHQVALSRGFHPRFIFAALFAHNLLKACGAKIQIFMLVGAILHILLVAPQNLKKLACGFNILKSLLVVPQLKKLPAAPKFEIF
jgi:hypothetical protein